MRTVSRVLKKRRIRETYWHRVRDWRLGSARSARSIRRCIGVRVGRSRFGHDIGAVSTSPRGTVRNLTRL